VRLTSVESGDTVILVFSGYLWSDILTNIIGLSG
jgi:hypothetical protein